MGCFVRGDKKWHGMFCPGMFCPAPADPDMAAHNEPHHLDLQCLSSRF